MENIREQLSAPLNIGDIDFRVQSISKKGWCRMLAYKNARVDMERLDNVLGPFGWAREHSRDNKNCTVRIWDDDNKQWVGKEDTGVESFSEKEKGLASDSFKRACFNLGIGRELYNYPDIFFQLLPNEFKEVDGKVRTTFDLDLRKWKWELDIDLNGKVKELLAFDDKGRRRYSSLEKFNSAPFGTTRNEEDTRPLLVKGSEPWKKVVENISNADERTREATLKQIKSYYRIGAKDLKELESI